MNANSSSTDNLIGAKDGGTDRSAEKEEAWQQIQQHFQTTQTSLSVRLVCEGRVIQQLGDIKSGVREASRLFTLQHSPQKAEELIASQENLFNRKCQQWEQAAKSAEARERATATGGGQGGASSAANRRKLEAEHIAVRGQINNAKQCLRRLRTALNRGIALQAQKKTLARNAALSAETDTAKPTGKAQKAHSSNEAATNATATPKTETADVPPTLPRKSRLLVSLQNLIGDGLGLEYKTAPYLDPFSDEGLRSREMVWTDNQPFCLIAQWEDGQSSSLNFKFWIVPKRPELIEELRTNDLPSLFLHTNQNHAAEKLNFELAAHSTENGPLSSEMNQLLNRLEAERFLTAEQKTQLCYLRCVVKTETDFDAAVKQTYLLELL